MAEKKVYFNKPQRLTQLIGANTTVIVAGRRTGKNRLNSRAFRASQYAAYARLNRWYRRAYFQAWSHKHDSRFARRLEALGANRGYSL